MQNAYVCTSTRMWQEGNVARLDLLTWLIDSIAIQSANNNPVVRHHAASKYMPIPFSSGIYQLCDIISLVSS